METIDLYRMNAATETVMSIVLAFLLLTCILQRKRLVTPRPLIILVLIDLLLMICQLIQWGVMIEGFGQGMDIALNLVRWKKLLYTAEYSLYYSLSVAYYNYIITHIRYGQSSSMIRHSGNRSADDMGSHYGDGHPDNSDGNEQKIRRRIKFLIIWGFTITCVFTVCINNPFFYYLDESGVEHYRLIGSFIALFFASPGQILSVITLIQSRKLLEKANFVLLILYIITPGIFALYDLVTGYCIGYLITAFYVLILYNYVDLRTKDLLAEKEAQLIRKEKELTERSTQIMLSQMQPHFLCNTLTTISSLCYIEGAEKAKQVVDKFSDYFRANLDSMGKERYVRFAKELEHIKTYLWLESVRFEDSLHVEYDIRVSDFVVPSLSIQPLVENAVKHGIRGKRGGGTVTLRTRETETEYLVIIEDNGVGFEIGTIPDDGRSHVGIENVRSRLEILSGGCCEIQSTVGQGTTVTVRIPKEGRK